MNLRILFLSGAFIFFIGTTCSYLHRFTSSLNPTPPTSPPEFRSDGALRLTSPPSTCSDQNPAFSPDGSRLVFTRFTNSYNHGPAALFLLDLQTGEVARLTPPEDQDNVNLPGSAWNPTNDLIVFASDRLEADDLWRITPDGSGIFRITHHAGETWYIEPSWSPDGQWIVFEARYPGKSEDRTVGRIGKIRANGSELTWLTSDPAFDDRQPNWSPTGERILFQRRSLPDGQWDVYTMDPDDNQLQNITSNPTSDTDASWSPDGKWIVCSSDYGDLPLPNLFAFPLSDSQPIRITSSSTHQDGAPSWSPDGRWIAFESFSISSVNSPASLWRISVPEIIRTLRFSPLAR